MTPSDTIKKTTAKKRTSPSANGVALTLDAIAQKTTPRETMVPLCLNGKMFAEHDTLDEELQQLLSETMGESAKLNDPRTARKNQLAKQIVALEKKMHAEEVHFIFRAVPSKAWSDLVGECPPREGNEADARRGVDTEKLAPLAVQASCVEPTGMDTSSFGPWWDQLSSGQQDRLFWLGAWAVNREPGEVPKSVSASALIQSSNRRSSTASE